MSNVLVFILFMTAGIVGAIGGRTLSKPKPNPTGKLIIVRDETDGKTYTALAMDPLVMSALEDGDRVELAVEVRQQNSFYNG